jgi:molecular chaperone GrpE (heat shock protein)
MKKTKHFNDLTEKTQSKVMSLYCQLDDLDSNSKEFKRIRRELDNIRKENGITYKEAWIGSM